MYSTLSTLNTTTEVPLSKAPNPQLLPGRRSINGCPLLRVCVHFGWVKCRAQIPSMGHHTWPYVTSLSLSIILSVRMYFLCQYQRWISVQEICTHNKEYCEETIAACTQKTPENVNETPKIWLWHYVCSRKGDAVGRCTESSVPGEHCTGRIGRERDRECQHDSVPPNIWGET